MKHSIFILIVLLLSFACKSDDSFKQMATLPPSTGGADELMFVLSAEKLDASEDVIDQAFTEVFLLLPQPTETFKRSTVKHSEMNSLLYRFKNMVIVTSRNTSDPLNKLVREILGEELYGQKKQVYYKRNVWANDQLVTIIIAPTTEEVNNTISLQAENILNSYSDFNLDSYYKTAFVNGKNASLTKKLKEFYGVNFEIPSDYKLAESEGTFFSYRKDTENSIVFIFFDVEEYNAPPADFNRGIEMRNERGNFVETNEENAYMVSDSTLGFYTKRFEQNGLIIYENRGLWDMENDYMGGPFINYYIIDQANNRVFLLDGFMYGPGEKNKKFYMRQLEAIFSRFELAN